MAVSTSTISLTSASRDENGLIRFGVKGSMGADTEETLSAIRMGLEAEKTFYEEKIEANTNRLTALSEFKTKLEAMQSAASRLRVPNPLSGVQDAFADRTISGYSANSTPFEMVADIIQTGTPQVATHTFKVNQLAKSDTVTDTATTEFADIGTENLDTHATNNGHSWSDGDLVVNGTSISLTSDMTLTDMIAAINAVSDTTNVTASYVTVTSGSAYRLKLTSSVTGDAITLSDTNSVLTSLDLAVSGATDSSLSAEIVVDGDTLTRSDNTVTDAISGLTIVLKQADNSVTHTIDIGNAQESIVAATNDFITAYNDLVQFKKDQTKVDVNGNPLEDAILNNNMFMRNLMMTYNTFMVSAATGLSGSSAIETLAEAGISFDVDGFLVVDQSLVSEQNTWLTNVINNADELKKTFGFVTTSTNTDFVVVDHQFQLSETVAGQNVTVTLSTDASSNYTATFTVGGDDYTATYDEDLGTITGDEGGPFEGIVVHYQGAALGASDSATSTVTMTQGVADKLAVSLQKILEEPNGAYAKEVLGYADSNKDLQEQVDGIEEKVETRMRTLRRQFQHVTATQVKYMALSNSLMATLNLGS